MTHGSGLSTGMNEHQHPRHARRRRRRPTTAIDPVCGMTVRLGVGKPSFEHDGTTYHFCSQGCRTKFAADPARYLRPTSLRRIATTTVTTMPAWRAETNRAAPATAPPPAGTLYTCPMHPQIVRDGPGSCPICGMALEPMVATGTEGPNPELVDMTRRLLRRDAARRCSFSPSTWRSTSSASTSCRSSRRRPSNICSSRSAIPAVLWCGWPFFERGWASLRTGNLNMFTLIARRHRRGLPLQRRRGARARASSRPRCATITASCRSISRRRR